MICVAYFEWIWQAVPLYSSLWCCQMYLCATGNPFFKVSISISPPFLFRSNFLFIYFRSMDAKRTHHKIIINYVFEISLWGVSSIYEYVSTWKTDSIPTTGTWTFPTKSFRILLGDTWIHIGKFDVQTKLELRISLSRWTTILEL